MRSRIGLSVAALAVLLGVTPSLAAPLKPMPAAASALPVTPVVVFGQDARRLPQAYAEEHALNARDLVRTHMASGLIQCGNAHGAGQLTLTDDVVTTAAHVFFDENGLPRARTCTFELTVNGAEVHVPVDLDSIVAGSTKPYDVEVTHDWAVARLTHGVAGVRPYAVATDVKENASVTFVARGHIDWGDAKKLSMQDCALHDRLSAGAEGTREFAFDCDTGDGASGGALMFDRDMTRVGAILVGWRSNKPFKAMPFSRTHYNFAVSLEGKFRQAVYDAAGQTPGKVVVQR